MGSLIPLIIYGAMAAAAWVAVNSFLNGYEEKGAAKQMAADKIVLEAVKGDRDTALAANLTLQGDVKKNAAETATCNKIVVDMQKNGVNAAAIQAAARREAAPKIASLNARIVGLEGALDALKRNKPEVSCAKALSKAGAAVVDTADGRLRDAGPAAAGNGKGRPPAAAVDPRPDAVRRAP